MTKPIVSYADPVRGVIDYLTDKLADYADEEYVQGIAVGAWAPSPSSPEAPKLPYVQVEGDGTPSMRGYPVTQFETVRVTVWHTNPTPARQLSSLVVGLLYAHPGDDVIFSVKPMTGPLYGRDARTGRYLNSTTFRVASRPAEL